MFGLFKKKKEEETETTAEQREFQEFAADFLPEETDITAVTGPAGLDISPEEGAGLRRASIGLTAWMDEYTHELRREPARLEAAVDGKLLEYLRAHIPRDFIITVTVRPSADGKRFLMTGLPKPGFDPELKALLEEQKKPVTLEAEGLGTFTLNRALGWFETAVDWMGTEISLTFDQAEEDTAAAQDTARALLAEQEAWDERVRACAADRLWERMEQEPDDDSAPLTREGFLARLEIESILTGPGGAFEFWFRDADLLWDCAVHVTGALGQGPVQAELEG